MSDVEDEAAGHGAPARQTYDIKKYKGLLENIEDIKDHVLGDRRKREEQEVKLKIRLKQGETEAALIQKELAAQLRVAGRSYEQILGANRDLADELRAGEVKRKEETEELQRQVKDLKSQLANAAKPWKEEVSKRDLKILKLQEAAADQERRLREALSDLPKMKELMDKEIKVRDEAKADLVREGDGLREQMKVEAEESALEVQREQDRGSQQATKLKLDILAAREEISKVAGPLQKEIKELKFKVKGLEKELALVDYAPLERQIKVKQLGYDKLVKDFKTKTQLNNENIEKMRTNFEAVIAKMDDQIQHNERECQKKLAPWCELVEKKEKENESLKARIEEFKKTEKETRQREAAVEGELRKELAAAKDGLEKLNIENYKMQRQLEKLEEETHGDNSPFKQIKFLEYRLDEVTKECEAMVKHKDKELAAKTDLVEKLQQRVREITDSMNSLDKEWDRRVQDKELGYHKLAAQLAFAEGQIVEERKRVAAGLETIRKRDATIKRLEEEHTEELGVRMLRDEALERRIAELEAEVQMEAARTEAVREDWEERFDTFRLRSEDRVADLRAEMAKRDRAKEAVDEEFAKVRAQFEATRLAWQDKARELEVNIRARDRAITALKNEIEFMNDSWEIKYKRLMGLFEKLQKKYDELIGPGGVAEAYRRCRDLKAENQELFQETLQLKEMIKKQKRQIRDLQLDIDGVMKETADIIAEKERGIAQMVGDMAKLQAKLDKETELKESLRQELTGEKVALAESFQTRVNQLEQLVESMRFTDRQELVDKIAAWKKAYERICIERDELEDEHQGLLDTKDLQLKKMAEENHQWRDKLQQQKLQAQIELDKIVDEWKKKEAKWRMDKDEVEARLLAVEQERDRALRDRDRAKMLADTRLEDPEKEALRKQIEEQKHQMAQMEVGVKNIVTENTDLLKENEALNEKIQAASNDWEPQIRWRDERYEAMLKEHEAMKGILTKEMLRAQETCKQVEEQVRRFPNPFEAELQELRDKYAQSQSGLQKMSMENAGLREEYKDFKEEALKDRNALEEQLKLASSMLREVASLGALKSMKGEVDEVERALNMDIDGDGQIA